MGLAGPARLAASLAVLSALASTVAAGKPKPGRLFARLNMEIAKVEPCADVTNNAVVVYNVQTRMINKVDFATSMKYNLTRSAASVSAIIVRITKCREIVAANSCEHFQTWRFDKNACKDMNDPNAVWKSSLDVVKPKFACPPKQGSYSLQNYTLPSALLQTVPLPWEGNVWLIRFAIMETPRAKYMCLDYEMRVHRVRH